MPYRVTHQEFASSNKPRGSVIHTGPHPKGFDLPGALRYARTLLKEGKEHVQISDDKGHSISGDDLIACCSGTKKLTPDLKAL